MITRCSLVLVLAACSTQAAPSPARTAEPPRAPLAGTTATELPACENESPPFLLRAVGATEQAVGNAFGVDFINHVGCACWEPNARIAIAWVVIDRSHHVTARAWSDRPDVSACIEGALRAAPVGNLADTTSALVFVDRDNSHAVELPGPYTRDTLAMTLVGDTAGAVWSTSELDIVLSVASEDIARCVTAPARALVRIDITDSRFAHTEAAGITADEARCVNAAFVRRSLYRPAGVPRRDGTFVVELVWSRSR